MKMIHAYIQRFMSEKVLDALRQGGVHGLSIVACEGFGPLSHDADPHYLDETTRVGLAPKSKIEIVCSDDDVSRIVEIIRQSAHTGRAGDGKVFVCDVTFAINIRTGATGEEAV